MPTVVNCPCVVDRAFDTHDGVEAQELDGDRRIRQIDLAGTECGDDRRRQRLDIDLQPDRQRRCRVDSGKDLVHAQHIRPELLVAKGVVAENVPALTTRIASPIVISTMSVSTVFAFDALADSWLVPAAPETTNVIARRYTSDPAPISRITRPLLSVSRGTTPHDFIRVSRARKVTGGVQPGSAGVERGSTGSSGG